ncbi:hypothetical protein, partial [Persicitalea sp.]|uniref:hypothetical protein n=1 Tax=Persicitalea sp. TaxID=3100273 RepID=UPI0035946210
MKIIHTVLLLLTTATLTLAQNYRDTHIRYEPVELTAEEKKILLESVQDDHKKYDPAEKMITSTLKNYYQYHTDATDGILHQTRGSLRYAANLLDLNDPQYEQRAFDIIRKTISLQDTVRANKTHGIWPYYLEEPLATKKSPADWNWADFLGVSLLDIYMGHQQRLPADLKETIKNSLIRAAESIQKRNVGPGYTNIAIMGTYMTYMTSRLFDLPEMQDYAEKRLQNFYDYTLENGYTEYNSPTYTRVALDELVRMKDHIVDKEAKKKIDYLYDLAWDMVARHFHKPSGQWAGPHSRSYSSLIKPDFYAILDEASGGKIKLPYTQKRGEVKIEHEIPQKLLPYFLDPKYPRTERDVLKVDDPQVIGTSYLTEKYALSTANRSSLWNQRRPFLAYWGTPEQPHYLQVRMLHDDYDFSAADFYSDQKENEVLAAVTFSTNGGDKHISIDRLQEGKFKAKDLRLRFEFGKVSPDEMTLPSSADAPFTIDVDGLQFSILLYLAEFDGLKGNWEKGSDTDAAWVDYVLYSGGEKDFDLTAMNEAALGFAFQLTEVGK